MFDCLLYFTAPKIHKCSHSNHFHICINWSVSELVLVRWQRFTINPPPISPPFPPALWTYLWPDSNVFVYLSITISIFFVYFPLAGASGIKTKFSGECYNFTCVVVYTYFSGGICVFLVIFRVYLWHSIPLYYFRHCAHACVGPSPHQPTD